MKKILISIFLLINIIVSAQNDIFFKNYEFTDSSGPILFKASNTIDEKYPLNNLFDGDFKTCWIVAQSEKQSKAWIKLPAFEGIKLNIFSGYGKSQALYYQNARPKKLQIKLYYGILPEGYCSENAYTYKIADLHKTFDINLKDIFGVQSFSIPIKIEELYYLKEKAKKAYQQKNTIKIEQEGFFITISVKEIFQGTKYKDVCLSELFFNRPYIAPKPKTISGITNIYVNDEENALYIDTKTKKNILVYQDKNSILQIEEISKDKRWAILFRMPAKNTGRAETTYLLFDLANKKLINNELKIRYKDFVQGSDLYFEQISGKLFLKYFVQDDLYSFIELK